MPFVGFHIWFHGTPADKVFETFDDPHHMLAPLAFVLVDNGIGEEPEDQEDSKRIAIEAIRDNVGADAYFERFEDEMRRLHAAEYKVDPAKCVSILTTVVTTNTMFPFLSQHNIWRPLVAMCSFHVRNRLRLRQHAWFGTQELFGLACVEVGKSTLLMSCFIGISGRF